MYLIIIMIVAVAVIAAVVVMIPKGTRAMNAQVTANALIAEDPGDDGGAIAERNRLIEGAVAVDAVTHADAVAHRHILAYKATDRDTRSLLFERKRRACAVVAGSHIYRAWV
jgi:hypothetical protein